VLNSLTSSIAADDSFSIGKMRSLAISLRSVRGDDLTFMTAPVAGTGRSPDGKQSIVNLDNAANKALWKAVANDKVGRVAGGAPERRPRRAASAERIRRPKHSRSAIRTPITRQTRRTHRRHLGC
jgi:hypothetical protein